MSSGPTTQLSRSDSASTLIFRNTSPSRSYRTFASGGYIIRISPAAIGIEVVPTDRWVMVAGTAGAKRPSATPPAIAEKIHSVR